MPEPLVELATYRAEDCATFRKVTPPWGGFSNMAGGFPLTVAGIAVRTSEALYQACRFPHRAELQQLILAQKSPMAAKMKGKPHRADSRPDWEAVKIPVMRWTLSVKLACHPERFGQLLLASGDRPVVEESHRDAFWGARPTPDEWNRLVGQNVLGRLLMELRTALRARGPAAMRRVEPPGLPDFRLCGREIGVVGEAEGP